jgi:hypothetical protein
MSIEQVSGFEIVETEDGWNSFQTTVKCGQEIWARLANLEYRHNSKTRWMMRPSQYEKLEQWAKFLKQAADWDEGSNSPVSSIEIGAQAINLGWKGTWTAGREVHIEFFNNDEGGGAYIRYNTGTGKPSSFLDDIFAEAKADAEGAIVPAAFASEIRGNLALAFGGYSQFGTEDVIKAVCGHVRNGTLLRREKSVAISVVAAALLQEEERWEGTGPPTPTSEEWPTILLEAERIVGECWEQQRGNQGARGYGAPKGAVRAPAIVD